MASNIVAQAELRRALVQRFGRTEYEASAFPRMFDETPQSQLLTATQRINGEQAVVHLARGSNLQFIRTGNGWKFDFFHTTTARPAQLLASAERDVRTVRQITREVSQGDYGSVREAQEAYQRRRQ
jgi:hypothetical protein